MWEKKRSAKEKAGKWGDLSPSKQGSEEKKLQKRRKSFSGTYGQTLGGAKNAGKA